MTKEITITKKHIKLLQRIYVDTADSAYGRAPYISPL